MQVINGAGQKLVIFLHRELQDFELRKRITNFGTKINTKSKLENVLFQKVDFDLNYFPAMD